MVMNENGYLNALNLNPNSPSLRRNYADFLDKQGRVEEANRQRSWIESKDWIEALCDNFCQDLSHNYGGEDQKLSFQDMITLGREAYENIMSGGESILTFNVGPQETLKDQINDNKVLFWHHWSIITGDKIPEEYARESYVACGC